MGLIDAGKHARLDRFIGYYKPYATSHDELDKDKDVQEKKCATSRARSQRRCANCAPAGSIRPMTGLQRATAEMRAARESQRIDFLRRHNAELTAGYRALRHSSHLLPIGGRLLRKEALS